MDLTDRLAAERRGRLAAERLLDLKSRELFAANRKLSQHAHSLSGQIIEQRDEAERMKEHTEKVQQELRRAEEHVEVVERRLWDSVETISDGFAVFDVQDRLIAANTAWLSIFEYSEHIGPGTLYLEVLRIALEDGYVDLQGMSPGAWIGAMLERWDTPGVSDPQELRLTNGRWYRLVDRRARDGDMVCLAQDITALKEREKQLKEARHRAEAASRAKSAFLANMSHELRTPMNGVVAMAEMLLESGLADEQQLYVSTIKSSGEALLEIINHVLDFSKLEAERLVLRPEPFDLERLVHEIVTLLGPTARDKQLSLLVDYDLFSPTMLVGDAMRIRQILINLVGNAVKFTDTGHVLVRVIGYEAGPLGWSLHITVEDTGIGIPQEMQDHVFGSFAQVESEKNRAFEGTGLGLAITRQLVHLMGGEIWVDSAPGEGSCFGVRLTLPAAEDAEPTLPRVDTTVGSALVVAPEGHEGAILCRQLQQLGLEVARAATGADALSQIGSGAAPQITVIDDALQDTSGVDLAEALEKQGCRSARLLVRSGALGSAHHAASGGDAERSRAIHGVLTRPMLRRDLFEGIAALPSPPILMPPGPLAPDAGAAEPMRADTAPAEALGETASPDTPPPSRPTLMVVPSEHDPTDVAAPAAAPAGDTPPAAASGNDAPSRRPMRVLAAEDNKTNRLVLEKLLGQLEIELHFAVDGLDAVEKYRALTPDLVLMDISMPRMDGKSAARTIRELEAEHPGGNMHVPIVAMTAHALAGDREEILASGIDRYMTKPLRRADLTAQIMDHCPPDRLPPQGKAQASAG